MAEKQPITSLTWRMPSSFTAENVEQFTAEMLRQDAGIQRTVTLDFTDTANLTTPGVQILLSLERSLSETAGVLVVTEVRHAIREVFCDLGFERLLKTVS